MLEFPLRLFGGVAKVAGFPLQLGSNSSMNRSDLPQFWVRIFGAGSATTGRVGCAELTIGLTECFKNNLLAGELCNAFGCGGKSRQDGEI